MFPKLDHFLPGSPRQFTVYRDNVCAHIMRVSTRSHRFSVHDIVWCFTHRHFKANLLEKGLSDSDTQGKRTRERERERKREREREGMNKYCFTGWNHKRFCEFWVVVARLNCMLVTRSFIIIAPASLHRVHVSAQLKQQKKTPSNESKRYTLREIPIQIHTMRICTHRHN